MKFSRTSIYLLLPLCYFISGCALIGNVKPVAEKSDRYDVIDLSENDRNWVSLDSEEKGADSEDSDAENETKISDLAYQSKKSASIISLNSACRTRNKYYVADLKAFRDQLFVGMARFKIQKQEDIDLQGHVALKTTANAQMNKKPIRIQSVVFRSGNCIYDAMYIAKPKFYDRDQGTFAKFVGSIKLPQ